MNNEERKKFVEKVTKIHMVRKTCFSQCLAQLRETSLLIRRLKTYGKIKYKKRGISWLESRLDIFRNDRIKHLYINRDPVPLGFANIEKDIQTKWQKTQK